MIQSSKYCKKKSEAHKKALANELNAIHKKNSLHTFYLESDHKKINLDFWAYGWLIARKGPRAKNLIRS